MNQSSCRSKFLFQIFFAFALLTSTNLWADNKYYLGFTPQTFYETDQIERMGGAFDLRFGVKLKEQYVVYGAIQGSAVSRGALDFRTADVLAKFKYIFKEERPFYVDLGVGVTAGNASIAVGSLRGDATKVGVVGHLGLGYEFKVTEKFFIAPEFITTYRRLGGVNFNTVGGGVNLGFYF